MEPKRFVRTPRSWLLSSPRSSRSGSGADRLTSTGGFVLSLSLPSTPYGVQRSRQEIIRHLLVRADNSPLVEHESAPGERTHTPSSGECLNKKLSSTGYVKIFQNRRTKHSLYEEVLRVEVWQKTRRLQECHSMKDRERDDHLVG